MYGYHTLLHFVTTCFYVLYGTQVEAHFYDALDPARVDLDEWHQREPRIAERSSDERILGCEKPNFYICEEHPNLIHVDIPKTCNYRNVRYHEQIYRWVAGWGCLIYTPDFLYAAGYNTINLNSACLYGGLWAPCLEMAKSDGSCGCYPFDPALTEVANAVREALILAAHGRWEQCFYTASDCCSHQMSENGSYLGYCDTTFDGWTCWDEAKPDTVATAVCSEFAYSNSGPSCNHYSTKRCFHNGTWEIQTDYSTCSITPRLVRRYRFHIAVLSFSVISCLPAVFIFFFYKRLRVTRVSLHRNLLIAIILRNVLVIISRSEIYIDELTNSGETVMSTHGYACRVLAIAERIAANCVFVAMLVEGIYLHRTIVAVFKKKYNMIWLYGIGAVIAIIPVVVWSFIMGLMNNHSCWLVYTVDHIQWILDAPRIAILCVNTVLFFDVLRVLLTKIRNSENASQLSTTKATLFLLPIFGTQFLLTAFRPTTTDCTGEQIYYYVSYAVEGLQGFTVAMLYCYINKEVHMLIKATYKKTENAFVSRIRRDSTFPRSSNGHSDRRLTCSTGLPSQPDDKEQSSTNSKPKLHVAEIISIQASERLAEILEPIYETIQNGVINEGYDSLERSATSSLTNRYSRDDYYAFTNASSISIECQDWIKCVSSPSSSVYNNSLSEYEARYLEKKFPYHPKMHEIYKAREKKFDKDRAYEVGDVYKAPNNVINEIEIAENDNELKTVSEKCTIEGGEVLPQITAELESGIDNNAMLEEIMQYIEQSETNPVALNPELLCPNRKDEDKVVFVDE